MLLPFFSFSLSFLAFLLRLFGGPFCLVLSSKKGRMHACRWVGKGLLWPQGPGRSFFVCWFIFFIYLRAKRHAPSPPPSRLYTHSWIFVTHPAPACPAKNKNKLKKDAQTKPTGLPSSSRFDMCGKATRAGR